MYLALLLDITTHFMTDLNSAARLESMAELTDAATTLSHQGKVHLQLCELTDRLSLGQK